MITWEDLIQIGEIEQLVINTVTNQNTILDVKDQLNDHNHDDEYLPISYQPNWEDIQDIPSLAPVDHDHDNEYLPIDYQPDWHLITQKPSLAPLNHSHDFFDNSLTIKRQLTIQAIDGTTVARIRNTGTTTGIFLEKEEGETLESRPIFRINHDSDKAFVLGQQIATFPIPWNKIEDKPWLIEGYNEEVGIGAYWNRGLAPGDKRFDLINIKAGQPAGFEFWVGAPQESLTSIAGITGMGEMLLTPQRHRVWHEGNFRHLTIHKDNANEKLIDLFEVDFLEEESWVIYKYELLQTSIESDWGTAPPWIESGWIKLSPINDYCEASIKDGLTWIFLGGPTNATARIRTREGDHLTIKLEQIASHECGDHRPL